MKISGKDKSLFYIVLVVTVIVGGAIFFFGMRRGTDSAGNLEPSIEALSSEPSLYTNTDFKVAFRYPQNWKPDLQKGGFRGSYLSFRGEDGHFGIDAVGAPADISITQAAEDTINAPGHVYGTSPAITPATAGGMEARLISPSSDQPQEHSNEAAFIIRYPAPISIGSKTYYYFVLYGDRGHLQTIADTFQFLP